MGALVSCSERQSQGPRASLAAEQTTGLSSWAAATPAWPAVPHRWAPQIVRMAGDRRAPRVGEDGSPSSYGELSRCPSLTGCGGRSRRGRGAQQLKGTCSGQQDARPRRFHDTHSTGSQDGPRTLPALPFDSELRPAHHLQCSPCCRILHSCLIWKRPSSPGTWRVFKHLLT